MTRALGVLSLLAVAAFASACSTSGLEACTAAGGRCVLGSAPCANRGTPDCNPDRNPGGGFCCLDQPATDAAGGDAQSGDRSDVGTQASGPAACAAAGGHCVEGVAFCANVGPGATPKDCLAVGQSMLCCAVNEDAGCTEIQAASYDQSCATDSDCVEISVGNACYECVFSCYVTVGAINAGAMAQYRADVDKTPAGAALCGCPVFLRQPPCCRDGQCHSDNECMSVDASADASSE
jgi:hypothetical protein